MARHVFLFDDDIGDADPKELLGGKGRGLREMTKMGIPVPPGFTISTETCRKWYELGERFPDGLSEQVDGALAEVEGRVGRRLGDAADPLLVSVRSGAAASMPGMMDTILNLGLNDATVKGLASKSGDPRFAFDAYRRLLTMYADVVMGVERELFEKALGDLKRELGDASMADSTVPAEKLEALCDQYKRIIETESGQPFPQAVNDQLWGAIGAVFRSWNNPRAIRYRQMQDIKGLLGTAVNVQAMVFGNMGDDSGSGVAFTRNPSNGSKILYGEFLNNAQGEDVVAGIRTPRPLTAQGSVPGEEGKSLEVAAPEVFQQIAEMADRLEKHFTDMQDIEFTVEQGRVYILQTRNGKRTAHAAVKIAVDMVGEGVLSREQALLRVDPTTLDQLLHAKLPSPEALAAQGIHPVASGLPASPGAAMGKIVLTADEAERMAADGHDVILVRRETSPEDIHGMKAAQGIVTATGGMTSHAAVVARGLGKCCVAGCSSMGVDYETKKVTIRSEAGAVELFPGDMVSLDGSHGLIYVGEVPVEAAATVPEFETLMTWADDARRLRVRANADTPRQAATARSYGAEGIGLCRTEHMFFAEDRLEAVRCMVLAEGQDAKTRWLARIEPMQREDFEGILEAMDGLPVTVRLLDWPLHEFLPREKEDFVAVAKALGVSASEVERRARDLHEVNPMLGHRGVRVGLTYPDIYRMQTRALVDAALACRSRGVDVRPEIMIPVVCLAGELETMRREVESVVRERIGAEAEPLEVLIGTMIELPRACLVAEDLAHHADFFSFGTNDLTQTTFGISRDDAGRFMPFYLEEARGLLEHDPFARLDQTGVGALIRIAVAGGMRTRPDIKLGVCGEHGGDPKSIDFCEEVGLAYVSCSPPRLPIARLAAAQSSLRRKV
ncbi:MAG: pyruvate, phosphate dikinase [Myxococcales bacterium]|nr:pyruvate, phosphate dikinase [Myxococcales bacterium]